MPGRHRTLRALLLSTWLSAGVAVADAGAPAPGAPDVARVEREAWTVSLEVPAAAPPGGRAMARVVIASRGGYHVTRDYPVSFRPDSSASGALGAAKVALGEGAVRAPCPDEPGEACQLSAPLPFTAAAAGPTRVAGTVAFSVCNADRCLIEKVALAATVARR